MDEFKKKQIEGCLECKIGHLIIKEFLNVYNVLDNIRKQNSKADEITKHQDTIKELAEIMELTGDFKTKCLALSLLTSDGTADISDDTCIERLRPIIHLLKPFYIDDKKNVPKIKPYAKVVFGKMNELDARFCKDYNKEDDEDYGIEIINNIYTKQYCHDEVYAALCNIFQIYTSLEMPYKFMAKGRCNSILFQEAVKGVAPLVNKEQQEIDDFCNRVNLLNSQAQNIIWEYIKYAPKMFGKTLQLVMAEQNMTEQSIKNYTGIETSAIQSLEISKEPTRPKTDISLIARALLVSEDVLYCGTGSIYGNWEVLLENENYEIIRNYADSLFENKKDKKVWFRETVRNVIQIESEEYSQLINSLFLEEYFSVYTDNKSAFGALLNKKEVYILLSVLEKMEKENT